MTDAVCHACRQPVDGSARFCASCGASLRSDAVGTMVVPMVADPGRAPAIATPAASGVPTGSPVEVPTYLSPSLDVTANGSAAPERFVPGTILAGRYRIEGRLGKGGMGEVYKASDLLLGQAVALKFLAPDLASDEESLARFRNEVRVARQISHPAVCRVYDLGQAGGLTYISMEFVDGEDLASLLRRIGRLPSDKALEIARQVCAGVAAAHDLGVIHRDLKPANIMLDAKGRARITDFGLAGLESQIRDMGSGTPAYMAPEQLGGQQVSARSDLYALGIVLHELYTGRRPGDGGTTVDLDPDVDRVIRWCTAKDPDDRPASARAVIAALPGGDPLAAALAAGETPSPDTVAAAGTHAGLQPRYAAFLAVAFFAGLLLYGWVGNGTVLFRYVPFDLTPDVLAQKAREHLDSLGVPRPASEVWGFRVDASYLVWLKKKDGAGGRAALATGRPAAVQFAYRGSPNALLPYGPGPVEEADPPFDRPGEIHLRLDTRGRLCELLAQPGTGWPVAPAQEGWARLFSAAGLDMTRFHQTAPEAAPPVSADVRAAWTGTAGDAPSVPLHVEAALWQGAPVFFEVSGPWREIGAAEAVRESRRFSATVVFLLLLLPVGLSAWLAWRNWTRERSDPRAALRLGIVVQLVTFALACANLRVSQFASPRLSLWIVETIGLSCFLGLAVSVVYLALEPEIRRLRPAWLITWTRAVGGEVRDPLVGTHVLFGLALGAWTACVMNLTALWWAHMGIPERVGVAQGLSGLLSPMAPLVPALAQAMLYGLVATFLIVMIRRWVRVARLPEVIVIASFAAVEFLSGPPGSYRLPATVFVFALGFVTFRNVGLLGLITWLFTHELITSYPLTLDLWAWYPPRLWLTVSLVLGPLAVWACRTAISSGVPAVGPHSRQSRPATPRAA